MSCCRFLMVVVIGGILGVVWFVMFVVRCSLFVVGCCSLFVAFVIIGVVRCLFYFIYWLLFVVGCALIVVRCLCFV